MNNTHSKEFIKSQIAAFASTCLDYLTVIGLTEVLGLWYVYSNVVGASLGAITNFFLGRKWTFKAENDSLYKQAGRYALVSAGSLGLNTFGLYALTEWTNLHYVISKVIIEILVAVGFNYVLQKHFVFKKVEN